MGRKKILAVITAVSMAVFLWLIYYELTHNVKEYVADTVFFMVLVTLALVFYRRLNLDLPSYAFFIIALLLHNAGAFGWYNVSPVSIQWDHITHIVGIFAATLMVYRFSMQLFTASKFPSFASVVIILLAAQGVGVFIEFYEFAGYFIVGEGVGGLGQGEGDIKTELGDSLWLNTMLDLVYNLIGSLAALIILVVRHRKGKSPHEMA
jgi:hypothetical protein